MLALEKVVVMVSGIYKIRNIITNDFYIGSTKNLFKRWKEHQYDLNNNRHCNRHLQFAWNKYSNENFLFEILEECTMDDLLDKEQNYIDSLKPRYNISLVALAPMRGRKHTAESKLKVSLANKGKVLSLETRKKLSIAHTGKKLSEAHCKQISERMLNTHYAKGNKGKPRPEVQKKVKDNQGNIFPSLIQASLFHKITRGHVSSILRKTRKATKSGIMFYYYNEDAV